MGWAGRGAIPVPQTQPSQGPKYSIFKAKGPTYGQMKAILEVSEIGSRIDLRIDPELTSELTRYDPPETSPQMASR